MALRIMVVDDQPDNLKLAESLAGSMECEIVAVADSCDAAQRLEGERLDGLLVESDMPRLDGVELTRRVRQ